jgi:CubicO group peptidase (beta-lactamase class C family)
MRLEELRVAGAAPGFQLCLGFRDQCLGLYTLGHVGPKKNRKITSQTRFDLASLTKVISVFSLMTLNLHSRAVQSVEQGLGDFFPSLGSPLKDIPLIHLLEHRSGLAPTFDSVREDITQREAQVRHVLQILEAQKLDSPGACVYSDVGFMLLGFLLESVSGQSLRENFRNQLGERFGLSYGPLHMPWTFLHSLFESDFVAPVYSLEEPGLWWTGEPQDAKARWLGGDAGHAGLFGTAQSVEDWGRELYLCYHGKGTLFSDRVLHQLLNREPEGRFISGWDRPTPPSQAGSLASERMIGHLGYTGCSFWMDLEKGHRVTLLSHRHGPDQDESLLGKLRPGLHDWIYQNIFQEVLGWN